MPTLKPGLVMAALLLCALLAGGSAKAGEGLVPKALRCESKVSPLGIDERQPRLSWIVESAARAQKQTAYQILAAAGAAPLKAGVGDLWDSGKVAGGATTAILYGGKPLASHQRVFWKVRVWDKDGKPSAWSTVAMWGMGLLEPGDWKAEWIGYDKERPQVPSEARHPAQGNPWGSSRKDEPLFLSPPPLLRTEFTTRKQMTRATLYASALGLVDMHLNGKRVSEDRFTPGWTDYTKRVYYRAYDVTPIVRRGGNALGAVLADGWYNGYLGPQRRRNHYGEQPRLRAQLHLEFADGTAQDVVTGGDWKAAYGPIREADFQMGEVYDARLAVAWDQPGFDDAKWAAVATGAEMHPVMQAHPGVPVRPYCEIAPVKITGSMPGVYVLDMGQNFAGVFRLRVAGKAGQRITLRFAEGLNPDGTLYTNNLRGVRATDTYICAGRGEETWEPRFTFHGYQYVEVSGLTAKPAKNTVVGLPLSSDTPETGGFECSDPMLNRLARNIYFTQRANYIEIPTDCPQRDERLGWTGDAQVYVRASTQNTDVQAFFTKWLVDLEDAQLPNGEFTMVAPAKIATGGGGPAWADAGVICPWTIYDVYGDRRVLERHYESMKRFILFNEGRCSPGPLAPDKYHCYGDHLSIQADTPKDLIFMAYFACSTRLVARAAEALGNTEDAKKFSDLYERIRVSFQKAYVAPDGRVKGNTQTAYALAIVNDLLTPKQTSAAAKHLIEEVQARDWHLSTGFVGTKDLMLALSKIGRTDVAYRLLQNDTFPSWGYSVKQGATSIWECWDGWTPEKGYQHPSMGSLSHYAYGAVYQWMVENIGGIRSDGVGYSKLLIAPQPGGTLTSARTSYRSVHGMIVTDWKIKEGGLTLDVTIPANTTATVILPTQDATKVRESGQPLARADGIKLAGLKEGRVAIEAGSGRYAFTITGPIQVARMAGTMPP